MIHIGIVDDHPLVRTGLREFFSQHVDLRVVGEAANGREAIHLARTAAELNVLVLDLSMPGQSGSETLRLIRSTAPDVRVLVLSGYPEEHYAVNLIRQGASGYLNKECEPLEIVQAIRSIALGWRYMSRRLVELLAQQLGSKMNVPAHERLSKRELEVFLKLAKGEKAARVATALALSAKTVSTYRSRVMDKLGLASNSDLTYYALTNKLIE